MLIDHVALVTPDAERTSRDLRERYGFGANGSVSLPHVGARSWAMPMTPPTYLELLQVTEPDVAAGSPLGRRLLDLSDAGGGLVAWCVLVDDIDAVSRRTGIEVFRGESVGARVVPWYTVTGPEHLPFFIAYGDDEGARVERWRRRYDEVAHDDPPTHFSRLDVGGPRAEYDAWLGPHDLPLHYVDGPPGLRSVTVATATREVEIR